MKCGRWKLEFQEKFESHKNYNIFAGRKWQAVVCGCATKRSNSVKWDAYPTFSLTTQDISVCSVVACVLCMLMSFTSGSLAKHEKKPDKQWYKQTNKMWYDIKWNCTVRFGCERLLVRPWRMSMEESYFMWMMKNERKKPGERNNNNLMVKRSCSKTNKKFESKKTNPSQIMFTITDWCVYVCWLFFFLSRYYCRQDDILFPM